MIKDATLSWEKINERLEKQTLDESETSEAYRLSQKFPLILSLDIPMSELSEESQNLISQLNTIDYANSHAQIKSLEDTHRVLQSHMNILRSTLSDIQFTILEAQSPNSKVDEHDMSLTNSTPLVQKEQMDKATHLLDFLFTKIETLNKIMGLITNSDAYKGINQLEGLSLIKSLLEETSTGSEIMNFKKDFEILKIKISVIPTLEEIEKIETNLYLDLDPTYDNCAFTQQHQQSWEGSNVDEQPSINDSILREISQFQEKLKEATNQNFFSTIVRIDEINYLKRKFKEFQSIKRSMSCFEGKCNYAKLLIRVVPILDNVRRIKQQFIQLEGGEACKP